MSKQVTLMTDAIPYQEFAKLIGKSTGAVRRMIDKGKLPVIDMTDPQSASGRAGEYWVYQKFDLIWFRKILFLSGGSLRFLLGERKCILDIKYSNITIMINRGVISLLVSSNIRRFRLPFVLLVAFKKRYF